MREKERKRKEEARKGREGRAKGRDMEDGPRALEFEWSNRKKAAKFSAKANDGDDDDEKL